MKVFCSFCSNDMEDPGALLFSPPTMGEDCKKYHVCTECFFNVMKILNKICPRCGGNLPEKTQCKVCGGTGKV